MMRIAVIFIFLFTSCSNKSLVEKIAAADKIVVIDNATKFTHIESRQEVVKGFKDLLETEPIPTECQPQGIILFKKGDQTLLETGYYKDASACNFLIIAHADKKMGYRLSFNALAYLGVYFQDLKKAQYGKDY